jgi:2',3'-cyclic-nucleotide 2'-phosphodiesterase (5'-nucleotidase family)
LNGPGASDKAPVLKPMAIKHHIKPRSSAAAGTALTWALTVIVACAVALADVDPSAKPLQLRVLATHDFHGALRPTARGSESRLVGGAAAMKTVMDGLEADCSCPTIRVDGGDQMQGTLESNLAKGESVVAAFNRLGLDAAAVGNHELDWGIDTLLARQREARYAWLAANVFTLGSDRQPAWADPYAIIDRAGIRVGVIGYATVSTPRTLRPEVTKDYEFRGGYSGIRTALDAVLARRPDFVVVVAHAGGECREGRCAGEMVDLANELPPGSVQLIAGGHAHSPGEGVVNSIPIVRAGADGRAIAIVDLYRRADGSHTFEVARREVLADEVEADAGMLELLEPYLNAVAARATEQVTTLAEPLMGSPNGDRRLGHLIAEAVRVRVTADVGLYNPGGVRSDLPGGPISYADVHRVLPFDDAVVRLTLTGRQLRQLIAQAGPRYYTANLQVERDSAGEPLRITVSPGLPEARAIADDESYTLATSGYLADGGDGFRLLEDLPREALGISTRDVVVDYLRQMPAPVRVPAELRAR